MLLGVIEAFHQVLKRSAAPIAIDRVDEFLAVAGRAMEVNHDDHVSVGGEEFGVPAVGPVVSPGALRPTVDEELHGIFLAGIEVGWLDQETLDFVVVGAGEAKGFEWGHRDLGENGFVQMSQRLRFRCFSSNFVNFVWECDRHPRQHEAFSVWHQSEVVVVSVAKYSCKIGPLDLVRITIDRDSSIVRPFNREGVYRCFALPLIDEVQAFGIL